MDYNTAKKQRNTARYRNFRGQHLAANPFCVHCLEEGIYEAATELDHIIPIHIDPDKFWDVNNVQGLCYDHHKIKSQKEMNVKHGKTEEHDAMDDWVNELIRKEK